MTTAVKAAYFNCSSGIAGDMILAACISAGVPARGLEQALKKNLRVKDWHLVVKASGQCHFPALTVNVAGDRHFDSPAQIRRIIESSGFRDRIKTRSLSILAELVRAEARVHRIKKEAVHFHELNSVDTLIDITGACLALDMLGIGPVCASPLNIGRAAPAAVEILKSAKAPVYAEGHRHEMTTPTGAAIITQIVSAFGDMPLMSIERSGWGAGTFLTDARPDVLRLFIGSLLPRGRNDAVPGHDEGIVVLETNIDDMDPRVYPYLTERLLAAGAHDVWLTQVIMKKGRPGILVSVLGDPSTEETLRKIMFKETTTLGIRRHTALRHVVPRRNAGSSKTVWKASGKKYSRIEYESAKAIALKKKVPLLSLLD